MRHLALAVLGAASILFAAAAPAQASHHWYTHVRTICLKKTTSSGVKQIAARTTWRLGNSAHSSNNIAYLQLKARLIPTTAGLNYTRPWGVTTTANYAPGLSQDGANNWLLTTDTPWVSPNLDWDLNYAPRWGRDLRPDWVENRRARFHEC